MSRRARQQPRLFSDAFDDAWKICGISLHTAATVALPVLDELDRAFDHVDDIQFPNWDWLTFRIKDIGVDVLLRSPTMEEFGTGYTYTIEVYREPVGVWFAPGCRRVHLGSYRTVADVKKRITEETR